MKKIVRKDGKKICLDTEKDQIVYNGMTAYAQRTNEPSDNCTRGIDMVYHKCIDGELICYLFHWSRWQGETSYIEDISMDDAQRFLEENIDIFDQDEIEHLEAMGLLDLTNLE